MSSLNYVRKVYIGWFVCDTCGRKLKEREFIGDTISVYCECGETDSMRLYDVKLKIPIDYRDSNNNKLRKVE